MLLPSIAPSGTGREQSPGFPETAAARRNVIPPERPKDVTFRVHPITDRDADEIVASLRAAKLLEGVRGEKPVCVAAYKEALLRVSRLVQDFHGIREIDVNPFMLGETAEQSVAVDARIRIDPAAFRAAR